VHNALDLLSSGRITVLTGAGVSTDSGIPDYRGPGAPVRTPMTYQEFVSGPTARQRYWARSFLGWSRMKEAEPNAAHRALARLEVAGHVGFLVTQNVDGLHERAGSQALCALHGRIADVICLDCRSTTSRVALQELLASLNHGFGLDTGDLVARPDGDVELDDTAGFTVPGCIRCGGILKPDVVFFGENVPRPRVQRCYDAVESADALLVAGSSLTVMSGLRFVRRADKLRIPVVIVNRGTTRGDDLATHKVEAGCAEFLTLLTERRTRAQDTSRRTESTIPAAASTSP
jgi:NAD-dependent SIR2 family protein deacetylase